MKTRFEIRPPFIIFHDNKPGQHAALSVGNIQLAYRSDASSFDDANRAYAWGFEGTVKDGDRLVFSTDDHIITGVVHGTSIDIEQPTPMPAPPPSRKPTKSKR